MYLSITKKAIVDYKKVQCFEIDFAIKKIRLLLCLRAIPHFGWFPDLGFASVETNLRRGGSRCRGPLANQRKVTISNEILLID